MLSVLLVVGFLAALHASPEPLSAKALLKVIPTDESIAEIYKRLSPQKKVENSIPMWGDVIVWSWHQLFLSA